MAGGKTRALCEEALDLALEHPGILLPLFRQKHTAITNTTRKTFYEQVLPPELRPHVRIKNSQGEDWIRFWNKSEIHFVGLDDPGKWFSSEIGQCGFDEAHEMDEKDVILILTRLRQRCQTCILSGVVDCGHMPHGAMLTFNPANPGHWLQQWFILGAEKTERGFKRDSLYLPEATASIGSSEFVIAKPSDNPYLPPGYVDQSLAGLPPAARRRYLEGLWEYVEGACFFDLDALTWYQSEATLMPILQGVTAGSPTGRKDDPVKLQRKSGGGLQVFKTPVRERWDDAGERKLPAHRYVIAVDAASGTAQDWSAIQVIDVDELEQVAELQVKLDPDQLALEAFRLAAVYNGGLIVPETTGGWGFAVVKQVQKLLPGWKGAPEFKPRIYTRPVIDRLSQKFTDKVGFDTNLRTRGMILTTLEQLIRERLIGIPGQRTLAELGAFAYDEPNAQGEYKKPQARAGSHDDLCLALAIGAQIAVSLPRQLKRQDHQRREPAYAATGWGGR